MEFGLTGEVGLVRTRCSVKEGGAEEVRSLFTGPSEGKETPRPEPQGTRRSVR
jgi:hypothetical protein